MYQLNNCHHDDIYDDMKEATSELISELIKTAGIRACGVIIFQEESFEENMGEYLNNLTKRDTDWLYITLDALKDARHVALLCESFTMLDVVGFHHRSDEIFDPNVVEIITLSESYDAVSWLVEKADLGACAGLLWSSAMWLNTRSLHILGSKILFGYGHLLDQALIAAKDLVTIGRVGDLNIEPNTTKSLELEQLYMSRHTHSWTNVFGHSAVDRIYESLYTMHPEKSCVVDGVKEYLRSTWDAKQNKYPMIMSRRRQLLSLAPGRRCAERSWDSGDFTSAAICSAGYSGAILTPAIISKEGLTTSVIKVRLLNSNTAVIPACDNPLCTKIPVENILGNLRQWWAKVETLASTTKMESSVYSLLARMIGLQGPEMQLAGVVISGSVQWNRTQLRYIRIIRDIAFAVSYEQWILAWDTDGKMVLHNSSSDSFVAICAGKGIFGGYVCENETKIKGIALLALNEGEIETATLE